MLSPSLSAMNLNADNDRDQSVNDIVSGKIVHDVVSEALEGLVTSTCQVSQSKARDFVQMEQSGWLDKEDDDTDEPSLVPEFGVSTTLSHEDYPESTITHASTLLSMMPPAVPNPHQVVASAFATPTNDDTHLAAPLPHTAHMSVAFHVRPASPYESPILHTRPVSYRRFGPNESTWNRLTATHSEYHAWQQHAFRPPPHYHPHVMTPTTTHQIRTDESQEVNGHNVIDGNNDDDSDETECMDEDVQDSMLEIPVPAVVATPSATDGCCFRTPNGALLLTQPDGTPMALLSCASTNLSALLNSGMIQVTNLLNSGATNVSAILDSELTSAPVIEIQRKYQRWTEEEDSLLYKAVDNNVDLRINWNKVARRYFKNSRTAMQCKNRWKKCLHPELNRGAWTETEDAIIIESVGKNMNWTEISKFLPGRLTEQARERWMNQLDPSLNKNPWTNQETEILVALQSKHGNHWKKIAKALPGRSENAVKNRWHNAKMTQRRKMRRLAIEAQVADQRKVSRDHGPASSQTQAKVDG